MTTSYYQNVVRNLRLILKCGICGHHQKLQFHHIKPTKLNGESRGQNKRFRDIVNHPDCYIPLCYFCHQKVTSREIRIYFTPISKALTWYIASPVKFGDINVI